MAYVGRQELPGELESVRRLRESQGSRKVKRKKESTNSRYLKNGKKKPLKQRISEGFFPEIQ